MFWLSGECRGHGVPHVQKCYAHVAFKTATMGTSASYVRVRLQTQEAAHCPQVLTGDEERVATWRQLAQSWQDMWLKWDSGQETRRADAQADVGDEERMAFVSSLLAQASTPWLMDCFAAVMAGMSGRKQKGRKSSCPFCA